MNFRSFGTYTFWVIELQIWQHWKLQMCKFVCKKGVWPPIFFHGWPLIYLGSLSFEFQVIWNIRNLSNCTLKLTTLKIANVQICVQKRGSPPIFFQGWPLIYLGSLSFEFQVIWNIYILSNWSSTSENDENCKCAKFWQKRVWDKKFFHWWIFLCIGS